MDESLKNNARELRGPGQATTTGPELTTGVSKQSQTRVRAARLAVTNDSDHGDPSSHIVEISPCAQKPFVYFEWSSQMSS